MDSYMPGGSSSVANPESIYASDYGYVFAGETVKESNSVGLTA
jgi:hypothetical protein